MTEAEYRAHPARSYSSLKWAMKSALEYRHRRENPMAQTPAMLMGCLAEACILESRALLEIAALKPDGISFATKEGKAWRAAQTLPVISAADAENVYGMWQAVKDNKAAQSILALCPENQRKVFGEVHGLPCKGMLDRSGRDADGRRMIVDLKKVQDASPAAFGKTVVQMRYHIQAALYTHLLALEEGLEERPLFCWVCVEENAPHDVACYYASESMMELGDRDLKTCIDRVAEAEAANIWQGNGFGTD